MIEAFIVCRHSIRLADLDLELRAGQEIWLSDAIARKSKDLTHAANIGAVRVYRKERVRMAKPLPPHVRLSRKGRHDRPPRQAQEYLSPAPVRAPEVRAPEKPEKPEKVMLSLDGAEIANQIREALTEGLAKAVPELVRAELSKQEAPAQTGASASEIAAAISEAMSKALPTMMQGVAKGAVSSQGPGKGPEEPLYMPDNLVDKTAKGNIKLKTDSTESNVNEATAALKKLRKKRT